MVLLFLVFILAVFFGSVSLRQDDLSAKELARRAKRSQAYKLRLRRQESLTSLIVMARLGTWIFLILFVVLSTLWFGWVGGFFLSLLAAALYPVCTRMKVASTLSTKLYVKVEPYLLTAAEKVPWLWRFFHGRIADTFGSERVFASREELSESIAASTGILTDDEQLLLANSLSFRDKKIKEVMTPRGVVQTVKKDEFIGPLVLDELHSLGHSRLPVIDGDIDHVVGVLHLRSLLSLDVRTSESAEKLMDPQIVYIHEDDSLQKALTGFIKKRQHLFVVVNSQRETVGLVTLEDVIETLIGKKIVDEDDVHDDMRVVADEKGRSNNNSPNGTYL